jgi:hypothetical protein
MSNPELEKVLVDIWGDGVMDRVCCFYFLFVTFNGINYTLLFI